MRNIVFSKVFFNYLQTISFYFLFSIHFYRKIFAIINNRKIISNAYINVRINY